jgi:hypothetical protein
MGQSRLIVSWIAQPFDHGPQTVLVNIPGAE